MKICPFLVAGQDSLLQLRGSVAVRDAARLGSRADDSRDPEAAAAAKSTATGLWAIEEEDDAAQRALECLGEPCRFFHAGGCRFDALFAAGGQATSSFLLQDGDAEAPSLAAVLQEVWSLQRENLKEMIGSFRRLETAQGRQDGDLTGKIEGLAARFEETRKSDELVVQLDRRFETLQGSVTELQGSLQAAFGGSAANLGSQIDGLRNEIQKNHGTLESTRAAVERTHGEVERAHTALSPESMSGIVQEKLETAIKALQKQFTSLRRELSTSAGATQARVQELMTASATAARAELEQSLQRVLQNNQNMQELRAEMQGALLQLANQVREIATAASALATASQRTEAIVAEQRTFSEGVLQRERQDAARRLNNAGVLAYHEGAYDTSVARFREALEQDPALAVAWNNLGLSFTEMQQDDQALEAYKKALELDPRVGQVYNNLGYLYHRRGELEQAVEMYERATVRAHDTSAAWSNLANALYALHRVDDAVGAWRRALELDPANDKASRALERLGLATSH